MLRAKMTFYLSATILISLLMVALTIHVLNYSGFNKTQKGWFIATFATIIFCSWAEYAVHCGFYDPKFKVILTILTVLQFSLSPLLAMSFSGALGLKHQIKTAIIYFSISLFVEVLSAPFGWIFYFNNDGYFRGDYFIIYEILYFVSLAYLIVGLFFVGKNFKHRDAPTIISIFVILIAGILPMTFEKIHISYIAIGISACVAYIYYNDLVQQDVKQELVDNQRQMSDMQSHIITGLASLIESRDMDTGEHVARTSQYVKTLAEDCKKEGIYVELLTDEFISNLYLLAPLHDVGKIVVSDQILRKPGILTPQEREEMKKHAAMGGTTIRKILDGITDEEYLKFASDIATYHHEWWDGSGYPEGLKGEEIPLSARIMAIADVYDALTTKRCYKEAIPSELAFEIMKSESGTHFDPALIDVFMKYKEKYYIRIE